MTDDPTKIAPDERRQTIVRRRRTRDFAIVPNEVMQDRRMTLEARGALAWLLSRPDDWQVIPAALRDAWAKENERLSRDRVYRLLDEMIASRYVDRNRLHSEETGKFMGYEYVAFDEPIGRGADSSVTREAIDATDDAEASPGSAGARGPFVTGMQDGTPNGRHKDEPCPGLPETAEPYTAAPSTAAADTLLRTDSQLKTNTHQTSTEPRASLAHAENSVEPTPAWDDFKAAWSWSETESTYAAELRWHKMQPSEKRQAVRYAKSFINRCKDKNVRICHAKTYLEEKRWERLAEATNSRTGAAAALGFTVNPGTPQFIRWKDWFKASGQWTAVSFMERYGARTVPSEWPPPMPDELTQAVNLALGGPLHELTILVPAESLAMEAWYDAVKRIHAGRQIKIERHPDRTKPHPRPMISGALMPTLWPPGYDENWRAIPVVPGTLMTEADEKELINTS